MSFIVDKQSLDDLNLLGKYKPHSIYSLFNRTQTGGGEKQLEALFRTPLQEVDAINRRSDILRYFQERDLGFPFQRNKVEAMERYLHDGAESGRLASTIQLFQKKALQLAVRSEQYDQLLSGINATVEVLYALSTYITAFGPLPDHPYQERLQQMERVLGDHRVQGILKVKDQPWSWWRAAQFHHILGAQLQNELKQLLETLYELDVYVAVGAVARERQFNYARALPANDNRLLATDLRHPALDKAVGNSLSLSGAQNVFFLTGANMAGKSTLMKTIGVSLYLAHLGFPLAAQSFEFSIMDGLYSSINVPDDIQKGYSHFFAEVLRVKEVAIQVRSGKRLLVLFDELFKGTNVKDAYDATLAVSKAFATYSDCLFVISTHIIEVGEALGADSVNVQFRYLPTVLEGTRPRYTYRLEEGITSDRQGMMIIENERILEIIKGKEVVEK